MSEEDKNKEEELTPILGFGATMNGTDTLVGQVVSLNLKRGPFFRVGDISLTPERYWTTVSDGMPIEYYDVIRKGLMAGYIVRGKERIVVIERPEGVLEAWSTMVTKEGRSPTSIEAFKKLIKAKTDKGYSLAEIARHCLKIERNTKNREDTTKLLEQVLMFVEQEAYYDREVSDDEEGKIDVTLIRAEDGSYKVLDPEINPTPKPPVGHIGGKESASDVLDNVLEL
jgi:hypothetical protein